MSNDKFHHQRKAKNAEDFRRRSKKRAAYDCVLIVCEDSVSAPSYFERLKKYYKLSTANIEICGKECGSDPLSVVSYAIQKRAERESSSRKDGYPAFDEVFCVIDRDEHENFHPALEKASAQNPPIKVVFGVPCFEVWLRLHFGYASAPYYPAGGKTAAAKVVDDLKQYLPAYDKGKMSQDVFEQLIVCQSTAIANAIALKKAQGKCGGDKYPNPYTSIHDLVIYLKDMKLDKPE